MPNLFKTTPRKNASTLTTILAAAALGGCSGESGTPVDVIIQLPGPAQALSKAVIAVDYSRAGAIPAGGRRPSCTALLPYLDATFSDDGRNHLIIDVSSIQGFSAPADLVACRMLASDGNGDAARIQSRLAVRVDSALDMKGQPVGDKRLAGLSSRIQTRADRPAAAFRPAPTPATRRERERPERQASARPSSAAERGRPTGVRDLVPSGTPAPAGRPGGRIAASAPGTAAAASERSPAGQVRGAAPRAAAKPGSPASGSTGSPLGTGPSAADSGLGRGDVEVPSGVVSNAGPTSTYQITLTILSTSGDLGALQVDVGFNGGSGGFVGNGSSVDCDSLLGGALVAFNNRNGRLRAGFIAHNGFPTPTPIASCRFKSRSVVGSDSFSVEVTDASDTNSKTIDPPPYVGVSDVQLMN